MFSLYHNHIDHHFNIISGTLRRLRTKWCFVENQIFSFWRITKIFLTVTMCDWKKKRLLSCCSPAVVTWTINLNTYTKKSTKTSSNGRESARTSLPWRNVDWSTSKESLLDFRQMRVRFATTTQNKLGFWGRRKTFGAPRLCQSCGLA